MDPQQVLSIGRDGLMTLITVCAPLLLTVMIDLTERRRVERALQENERRMRSLLASMDDLVFVLDKDLVFRTAPSDAYQGDVMARMLIAKNIKNIAITYVNNGKLFVGPHLLVGIAMSTMLVLAAALSPLMQQGNLIARKLHVGLNMGVFTLFLWQAVTGMQIVNKIWENRPA